MKHGATCQTTSTRKTRACGVWKNPHAVVEELLHSDKIGIWVVISRRCIIGPIFFTEAIDSERYCLQIFFPFISWLNEVEINIAFFQQDYTTSHTAHHSMKLLEDVFGEQLISRGIWPPRSPDFSALDFISWGAAKSKVDENNPKSIPELKIVIQSYVQFVTAETSHKVFDNKVRRVTACEEQGEKHLQHFL
jgi:hypothetical protein